MTTTDTTISIRLATPDDSRALARLAALDSGAVPAGPVLLAERDGEAQAALALAGGATLADPFVPTAELLALLRVRATRLAPRPPLSQRLRVRRSARRSRRAFAA
jgi:hypothetical protein